MSHKISLVLQSISIALLVILIGFQLASSNGVSDVNDNDFIKRALAEEKLLREYKISIGEKYISITGDKISKSSYSTYIIGTATNTSDKTLYNVSIQFSFYKNGIFVGNLGEHYSEFPPKSSAAISIYAPDDFDTYSIDHVSAILFD